MHAEYTYMDFTIYEMFNTFCVKTKQDEANRKKKSESNNKTANKSIRLLNVKLCTHVGFKID